MKTFHYFIYYKVSLNDNTSYDDNCTYISSNIIINDHSIKTIQNDLKLNIENCNKVLIKNFILLYSTSDSYGDLK